MENTVVTPKVNESITINTSAEKVWGFLKTFDRVEAYAQGIIAHSEVQGEGIGCTRFCTMAGETPIVVKETLIALDSSKRFMSYTIDNPPMPVEKMFNTLEIHDTMGEAKVIWKSHFDVIEGDEQEIIGMVQGMLKMSLEGIKNLF